MGGVGGRGSGKLTFKLLFPLFSVLCGAELKPKGQRDSH